MLEYFLNYKNNKIKRRILIKEILIDLIKLTIISTSLIKKSVFKEIYFHLLTRGSLPFEGGDCFGYTSVFVNCKFNERDKTNANKLMYVHTQ